MIIKSKCHGGQIGTSTHQYVSDRLDKISWLPLFILSLLVDPSLSAFSFHWQRMARTKRGESWLIMV